jgi:hypothetical protein
VLLHACCIFISNRSAHADQLFTVHTFPGLVFTGTFLGVIPNGPDYFGIRQDVGTGNGISVHSIRVMFVELVKFSSNPLIAVRAFQTCAPSVLGASSHVGRIGCGN